MKIFRIDLDYIEYLRTIDNKVMLPKEESQIRPYIGVVFAIKEYLYFAPLTSVNKNSNIKFRPRIENKNKYYGAINLINMIPINRKISKHVLYDINYKKGLFGKNEEIKKYTSLLLNELKIISKKSFSSSVISNAKKIYRLQSIVPSYTKICCDFKKLELASSKYKVKIRK